MRAAFVLAGLGAGGAERVISLIAAHWVQKGWKVRIIAFDGPDDPIYHAFDPRIALMRLNLPTVSGKRLPGLVTNLRRISALRRILKRERPDLVVSFLTKINVITLLAGVALPIPVIVSERNNPMRQAAHPLWQALLHRLYRRAAAVVMQTRASLDLLPPAIRTRAVVVANPIMPWPRSKAAVVTAPTITAVGRLIPQKGFDLLIDAFARIAHEFPEWRLVIWGEGDARASLEMQIKSCRMEERIRLPGLTASPGEWIEGATAFVLSSRFEGLPNVVGEAMAAGIAIAAFDCPFGPAEMLRHNVDGLLVPPEDPIALAESLRRIMDSPALRDRLGAAARLSAKRFSPEPVVADWARLAVRTIEIKISSRSI